jgi:dihydrofolate synthase/folylpolyglutamate synthase
MTVEPHAFNHDAALAYLYGRIDFERNAKIPYLSRGLTLDRMRELAARLGNPHERYPIVHVAGTKGKGSTSAMIAAILTAAGYRTGLYTSPHLECVEERLAIDGRRCASEEFVEVLNAVRPEVEALDREASRDAAGEPGPTYFEITTAAAMLHFARHAVDAAVLEVGLGGRLDATNICQPAVSVVTNISFDHTRQLGNTLGLIAAEKAGIIKPGVPVVSGVTVAEPREVIEQIAGERGCRCFRLGREFHAQYRGSDDARAGFDYEENCGSTPISLPGLSLAMLGRHQVSNAAVALAAAGRLRDAGWHISEAALRRGIGQVHCPARTEVVRRNPTVVIDAAHNVASVQALLEVLAESFPQAGRRILVFAVSRDKDATGILAKLLPAFDVLVLTRFVNNPRSSEPETLAEQVRELLAGAALPDRQLLVRPDPVSAWETARELANAHDLICIAGSFFLAAALRPVVVA